MDVKDLLFTLINNKYKLLEENINKEELKDLLTFKSNVENILKKINGLKKIDEEQRKNLDKNLLILREDFLCFNLNNIINLFPDLNADIKNELSKQIKLSNSIFFNSKSDKFLNTMDNIFNILLNNINTKLDKINNVLDEEKKLKDLVDILDNNFNNLFDGDINKIVEFLKNEGKNELEILGFIRDLFTQIELNIKDSYNKNNDEVILNNEEEIEIFEENVDNVDIIMNKIFELLKKYGYEGIISYFQTIDNDKIENLKSKLYKYGNINNIENIIKILKKYNINLLFQMQNGNLEKIIKLLLYSSGENIEKIFNLSVDDDICFCVYDEKGELLLDDNGKKIIDFQYLLEHVSIFFKRKRRYYKKGNDFIDFGDNESEIGLFDDFIQNIKFLQNYNINIKDLYRKEKRIKSFLSLPHEKILMNEKIFNIYGIPSDSYLSTLCCFNQTNPADTIDICIELDIFDYLKNKMSRIREQVDSPLFYRIARTYQLSDKLDNPLNLPKHQNAKQFLFKTWHGDANGNYSYGNLDGYISNPDIVKKRGEKLKLDTGIGKQNGSVIVNRYTRKKVLSENQLYNFKCFDEVIKNKNNYNISMELIDELSPIISTINLKSRICTDGSEVLEFGTIDNPIRISKKKFYRIYNSLCRAGYNIENNKDCILYSLTYMSILTNEEFMVIKNFIDKIFINIPELNGKVGKIK